MNETSEASDGKGKMDAVKDSKSCLFDQLLADCDNNKYERAYIEKNEEYLKQLCMGDSDSIARFVTIGESLRAIRLAIRESYRFGNNSWDFSAVRVTVPVGQNQASFEALMKRFLDWVQEWDFAGLYPNAATRDLTDSVNLLMNHARVICELRNSLIHYNLQRD